MTFLSKTATIIIFTAFSVLFCSNNHKVINAKVFHDALIFFISVARKDGYIP